jgi:hypothetical protein
MKKEVTPKDKGLRKMTSDKKRGNPKMQGAKKKRHSMKKSQPQNVTMKPPQNKSLHQTKNEAGMSIHRRWLC